MCVGIGTPPCSFPVPGGTVGVYYMPTVPSVTGPPRLLLHAALVGWHAGGGAGGPESCRNFGESGDGMVPLVQIVARRVGVIERGAGQVERREGAMRDGDPVTVCSCD